MIYVNRWTKKYINFKAKNYETLYRILTVLTELLLKNT